MGGRKGESFASPIEQRERIDAACARDDLELVEEIRELDVSGATPLSKRVGLRRAIELVEAGAADVVVVAYFDRLVRSLAVQAEIVDRVERAGGAILAVDVGEVRADTASRWLSSTMLGMVAEYHRRVTAERTADAKLRAVARGIPPFPNIPAGLRRRADGTLEPDGRRAKIVAKAVRLRADGAPIREVRDYLRERGIELSYHGVQHLLGNRMLIGELHFGEAANLHSHRAIVDKATWQRAQRQSSPRGRRAKSERLLARLEVLRCGTCGARMVVGTSNHGNYHLYRCPPVGDCPRRVTISAELAESVVVDAVRAALEGMKGTASFTDGADEAERELDRSERELDAAVRAFSGLDDVEAARERLLELRAERDRFRDRLAELQAAAAATAITVTAGDWDRLSLDARRALIRAVVERAVVVPGRGSERISVELRAGIRPPRGRKKR